MENLHKVGGSNQRLRQAKNYLWQGFVNDEIAVFNDLPKKQARNFQNYLRQHRFRIPDYQLTRELGICIGSGSVESWIKRTSTMFPESLILDKTKFCGSRVKIVGAQWNPKNVSQMLRLRCAYLNQDITLSICT